MAVTRRWSVGSEWGTITGTHQEVIDYLSVSGLGPASVHGFMDDGALGSLVCVVHANE